MYDLFRGYDCVKGGMAKMLGGFKIMWILHSKGLQQQIYPVLGWPKIMTLRVLYRQRTWCIRGCSTKLLITYNVIINDYGLLSNSLNALASKHEWFQLIT